MPSVSKDTAPTKVTWEGIDISTTPTSRAATPSASTSTADADLAPLFRGLPDDRAQLPRWGYVIEGRIGFRFGDHEETYEAGEAYYVGPDHTPVHYAGTEIVEFSPSEILNETIPVVLRNLDANGIAVDMSQAGEAAAASQS